jgi:hypothetical protein
MNAAKRCVRVCQRQSATDVANVTLARPLNPLAELAGGAARASKNGILIVTLAVHLAGCGCRGSNSRANVVAPKPPVALTVLSHTTYGYVNGGSVGSDHLWYYYQLDCSYREAVDSVTQDLSAWKKADHKDATTFLARTPIQDAQWIIVGVSAGDLKSEAAPDFRTCFVLIQEKLNAPLSTPRSQ